MALKRPKLAETEPAGHSPAPVSLTAATAVVDLAAGSSWKTWRFGNREWQKEVWRLYDVVPELRKLANRVGDSIAQARLYVTEVSETGEETGETADEAIRQLAAVPLGTGAQRDENLRLAGVDLAAAGECWIVGENVARDPASAVGSWFVVTSAALSRQGDVVEVKRPTMRGGGKLSLVDGRDILIRCWNSHPNDTDAADSFSRAAIPVLREIELLTKREFAELDSRLTGAGLLPLPEGVDFPRAPEDPPGLLGFMEFLQRTMATSIQDQSSAAAMVPVMFTVPDHLIEAVGNLKPINFWSDLSAEIGPMKTAAIDRFAATAELPKEVITGLADSNHWTAWLVTEEGIRWIRGYLGLVADALTRGFLRLALETMGVADPSRYAFAFDTSGLAARPNRLDDALKLREEFLISDEETVKAGAFDVEQMPSTAERAQQILLRLIQTQPDLILDPAVQAALGLPQVQSVGLPPTADQNTDGDPDDDESERTAPNGGSPREVPPPEEDSQAAITAALTRRIQLAAAPAPPPSPEAVFNAACKLMVLRALELAGGRLSTPQERRGRWAEVPRHELHHWVGPITAEKAARVTEGAWNHTAVVAADLGVNPDDLRRLLSGYVSELLTRGIRHHDDLLYAALRVANQGAGLVAA